MFQFSFNEQDINTSANEIWNKPFFELNSQNNNSDLIDSPATTHQDHTDSLFDPILICNDYCNQQSSKNSLNKASLFSVSSPDQLSSKKTSFNTRSMSLQPISLDNQFAKNNSIKTSTNSPINQSPDDDKKNTLESASTNKIKSDFHQISKHNVQISNENKNLLLPPNSFPHVPFALTQSNFYDTIDDEPNLINNQYFEDASVNLNNSQSTAASYSLSNHGQFLKDDYLKHNDSTVAPSSIYDEPDDEEFSKLIQQPTNNIYTSCLEGWNVQDGLHEYVNTEKTNGLMSIQKQVLQLYHTYKEFGRFTHSQQDDLELLEDTLIHIKTSSKRTTYELEKINKRKREARKRRFFCFLILGLLFSIFLLVILPIHPTFYTNDRKIKPSGNNAAVKPIFNFSRTNGLL